MSRFISLDEAVTMTGNYKKNKEAILKEEEKGKDLLPLSETIDKDKILTVLNREGCVSLRVYYGMDKDKKVHALLVGVDADDRDILPPLVEESTATEAASLTVTTEEGYIIEDSRRCPPDCPSTTTL